ncbi:MAG: hypothetical protein V8T45_11665, partial [Oscillospiraceae bacterium]
QNGQWLHVYAIIPQQKIEISHGPLGNSDKLWIPCPYFDYRCRHHVLTSQLLKFKGQSSFVFLF